MDTATLQRLILDRELGELSADTEALLEAYLASLPPDVCGEQEIASTVRHVRRALAAPPSNRPTALPPLRVARPPIWRIAGLERLAAAAAIGLAFFAGSRSVSTPAARDAPNSAILVADSVHAATGFWSIDRLRRTKADASPQSPSLNWTSPLMLPQPGEGS